MRKFVLLLSLQRKRRKKQHLLPKKVKVPSLTLREIRHQVFSIMKNPPEDKQPYLLELARIPFRFTVIEFNKPQQYLFSFCRSNRNEY